MPNLEPIENYNKTKKTKAEIWFDVKNILLKLMFSLGVTCLIIVVGIPIVLLVKLFLLFRHQNYVQYSLIQVHKPSFF